MIVLREGTQKRIVLASEAGGRCRGQEFLESLALRDRAKFERPFDELSERGYIHNKERFRSETDHIYCFKAGPHRLPCFFDGRDVVIVGGFTKKTNSDRRSRRELQKADKRRLDYFKRRSRPG